MSALGLIILGEEGTRDNTISQKKIVELIDNLESMKILKDSLIIITSDHGQLLGEHGKRGHGIFLYDELLRIPLFINYPDKMRIIFNDEIIGQQYVSLTKLRGHVLDAVKSSLSRGDMLYSPSVYSESWAIPHDITTILRSIEIPLLT